MIWAHILILVPTILLVLMTDLYALSWVIGKRKTLNETLLKKLHLAIWIGLIGMIVSGALMVASSWQGYLSIDLFKNKMLAVLVLVINGIFIGRHMHIASKSSSKDLSRGKKYALIASGVISTTSWIGAFVLSKVIFG